MTESSNSNGIQIVDNYLIVTLENGIDEYDLAKRQKLIMSAAKQRSTNEICIDISAVRVMDSMTFNELRNTVEMLEIIGAEVVLVGMRPGVASALVLFDVDINGINTFNTMDDGIFYLGNRRKGRRQ